MNKYYLYATIFVVVEVVCQTIILHLLKINNPKYFFITLALIVLLGVIGFILNVKKIKRENKNKK